MTKDGIQKIVYAVIPSLLVSVVVSGASAISSQAVQSRLLEDNIEATNELAKAVVELRLQLGVFGERYVTKDQFELRMREVTGK